MDKIRTTELLAALSDKISNLYFVEPETGYYEIFYYDESFRLENNIQKNTDKDFFTNIVDDIEKNIHPDDKEKAFKYFTKEKFNEIIETGETVVFDTRWIEDEVGENRWIRNKLIRFLDEDGRFKIVVGTEEITELKKQEKALSKALEIERKSLIDPLTGCRNRMALSWAYDNDYANESAIGVIVCDLNGLKKINDKDGHKAGDNLIFDASVMLIECFGHDKVYRIGGDEFVIVMLSVDREYFERSIDNFRNRCDKSKISISIGSVYNEDLSMHFEDVLKIADRNMYDVKRDYYRRTGIDRRSRSELYRNAEHIDALIDFGSMCFITFKADLTNNTYEIIHLMDGHDSSFRSECKTFVDVMEYPIKVNSMHQEDIEDYIKYTNLDFLRENFKEYHGKINHWVRYRSTYGGEKYHLMEVQFFASRSYTDDNQVVYVMIKDMGSITQMGRILFDNVLKELSENFESIFYIDFDNDRVYPYRMNASITRKQGVMLNEKPSYWDAMGTYIENSVHEKDKETMREICSKEYLQRQFKIRRAFSHDYRAIIDGNEIYYRIKFSNMDGVGELHQCVVGFVNVNSEVMLNKRYSDYSNSIIIVEDNDNNREILREILQDEYSLFEASNGKEALGILKKYYEEIALVITDLKMPVCDGFELISIMQADAKYRDIPIIVTTAFSDEEKRIKCLELGAADFISKPYNVTEIKKRVRSFMKLRSVTAILNTIEIDSVTGLYTKEAFYRYAQILIDSNPNTDYVVEVLDIIGFKAINEQYGVETGNKLLRYIADNGSNIGIGMIIGGRIGSDVFACLRPSINITKEVEESYIKELKKNAPVPNLNIKLGHYLTKMGRNLPVQQMCDRARIAMMSIKGKYGEVSALYDDEMRDKLLVRQQIIDSMENAIRQEQFQVFYQPKYDINDNRMAGAEALVRWEHPDIGFMNPGIFIPIFEQNGFISELDKFVWEKVCQEIAYWIEKGYQFPISVNVSRRDFLDPELADYIINLADKYSVPHELLHIEVTESAYSDNPSRLKETIGKLHKEGFVIELDDFGTGYSSITALNGMNIDVIKLDMSIIKEDSNNSDRSVLEFSMQLAQMMHVKTVQEGVETFEQLERVKSLGCTYVQGYYFTKPLSKEDFTKYVLENY